MSGNILFILPLDISCTCLSHWIEIKDFVWVDTAHCNIAGWISLRQSPLLVLSHNLERMTSKPKATAETMLGSWLLAKNLRTTTLVITSCMQMADCASYLEKFGAHVKQIKMSTFPGTTNKNSFSNMANIILLLPTIPNLRSLFLENCSLDETLLPILLDCTALRELYVCECFDLRYTPLPLHETTVFPRRLSLTNLALGCHREMMVALLSICDPACLESLSVTLPNDHSDYGEDFRTGPYELLQQVLPLCTRLVGLEFAGVEIDGNEFEVLIALCPQVEHLSIVGEYWVTDESVMLACALLTQLKTLNIAYTSCTDGVLRQLVRCQANALEGLFIRASRVTVEGIGRVLQNCPKLHRFGLQFDVNTSKQTAFISALTNYGHNLQYLNLHHHHAKHFDFHALPEGSLPALRALAVEHDGFDPEVPYTFGEEEPTVDEKHTPVLPQNASLQNWLTARPQLNLQESIRKEYFDIHAAVQDRLV